MHLSNLTPSQLRVGWASSTPTHARLYSMARKGFHAVCLNRKEPITNLVQSGIFIGAENWGDAGVYCIPVRRFDHLPTNYLFT
jgi:hypothetical protein